MQPPLPSAVLTFSISVEWENARFAELERTRLMLRALRAQLMDLPPASSPPVINFLHDRRSIDGGLVRQILTEEFEISPQCAVVSVISTDGQSYYEQKNHGALQNNTDIKIFLDCDVVPEPGWLAAILSAFDNPKVDAVGGETYIELSSFYSRAFALFWFFKLRDPANGLVPAQEFHANNVAFRANVFAKHSFPDSSCYRGQCVVLGRTMLANGLGLYVQRGARVSHPCPLGLWYFVARALHNGRDWLLAEQEGPAGAQRSFKSIYWNYRSDLVRTYKRMHADYRHVGLGRVGLCGAYLLAVSYFSVKALGAMITFYWPDAVAKRMPI